MDMLPMQSAELLDTMSCGRSWSRKLWNNTATAISLAEGNFGKATKCVIFDNRSIMVSMTETNLWQSPNLWETKGIEEVVGVSKGQLGNCVAL